jgi:hypothetical protein
MDWARVAGDVNTLADFCGRRDVTAIDRSAIEAAAGGPVDAVILFGGSILAGAAVLAEAIRERVAPTAMIAGGEGHTTAALRAAMAERTGWPDVERMPEAALFARYLRERLGLSVDLLEEASTNCGNNVTNALAVLRAAGVPVRRLLILQDATMQQRMDAGFRLRAPQTRIVNFATYRAAVVAGAEGLRYEAPPEGMWPVDRYVAMLLGEIPRLRDDRSGYGPAGAGYIAHVDVPDQVLAAHDRLSATGLFRARTAVPG